MLAFGGCAYFALRPAKWTIANNGTYHVCIWTCDAKPGVWTTTVPSSGNCLWIRHQNERYSPATELGRATIGPGQQARVELNDGEYFATVDCGTWTLQNGA